MPACQQNTPPHPLPPKWSYTLACPAPAKRAFEKRASGNRLPDLRLSSTLDIFE
ncbi:hypothetical protein E4U41_005421, partial [Claviceps citrina]